MSTYSNLTTASNSTYSNSTTNSNQPHIWIQPHPKYNITEFSSSLKSEYYNTGLKPQHEVLNVHSGLNEQPNRQKVKPPP
jgi:hypothetical protein